jgi:hypothetical protein
MGMASRRLAQVKRKPNRQVGLSRSKSAAREHSVGTTFHLSTFVSQCAAVERFLADSFEDEKDAWLRQAAV